MRRCRCRYAISFQGCAISTPIEEEAVKFDEYLPAACRVLSDVNQNLSVSGPSDVALVINQPRR